MRYRVTIECLNDAGVVLDSATALRDARDYFDEEGESCALGDAAAAALLAVSAAGEERHGPSVIMCLVDQFCEYHRLRGEDEMMILGTIADAWGRWDGVRPFGECVTVEVDEDELTGEADATASPAVGSNGEDRS